MPYMDSSDSDGDSEPEAIALNAYQEELYNHLERRRDALGGRITTDTKLIALYEPLLDTTSKELLRDALYTAQPAQLCQILDGEGKAFPPSVDDGTSGYYLYHTNRNSMMAPVDRLECRFFKNKKRSSTPDLTVAIEFHFNDYICEGSGIQEYRFQPCPEGNKILTFSAGPATSESFTLAALMEKEFGEEEKKVLSLLKSFLEPPKRQDIKLFLHERLLSRSQKERLDRFRWRLPGGGGKPLPSFGRREYEPFSGEKNQVYVSKDKYAPMRSYATMLSGKFKHPLVPFECRDVITTVKEWVVQYSQAIKIMDLEANESLRLWAKSKHRCRLYDCDGRPVLAVRSLNHSTLGGSKAKYKLPGELSVNMKLTPRTESGKTKPPIINCDGFQVPNTFGLDHYDAYFLITSHSLTYFKKNNVLFDTRKPPRDDNGDSVVIKPHYPSFTTTTQLATVATMQKCERWHQVLLNQVHETLKKVDFTEGADPEKVASAYKWLRNWVNWNAEQLGPINGLEGVLGGLMLIMGPAGTGKTLLLRGLTRFFHKLGFHVGFFAPANTNVTTFALQIMEDMAEDPDLDVLRIQPPSKDIGLQQLSEVQAAMKKVGHRNGEVCSFEELSIAMEQQKLGDGGPPVPRLEEAVLKAARERKLSFQTCLRDGETVIENRRVDAWEELRTYFEKHEKGELQFKANLNKEESINTHNKKVMLARSRGEAAYRACKRHVLGRCRFVITTLGNTRCSELMENWFDEAKWAAKRQGMIIFVDEGPKALEVDAWAPVVCERWADHVKGVIMAGDDKQLPPINTCSQGRVQYNPFNRRLNTSLPMRLINMGFPCYRLEEQRRMHPAISAFPNENFYGGILRNGPGTDRRLESVLPGLSTTLKDILTSRMASGVSRNIALTRMTDEHIRLQWLQVKGTRGKGEGSTSSNVPEHVEIFFSKVLPKLQAYFQLRKLKMADHVMIICAYGEAINDYMKRFKSMNRKGILKLEHAPRVLTVDSSQGQEASMVIFDGSAQENEKIGFLEDPRRCNVAVTRAKHVFWMLGGAMAMGPEKEKFHLTMYKEKCDREGRTVVMN